MEKRPMVGTYEQQAETFLEETGTTFKASYITFDYYFIDDKDKRDIWRITLRRNGKSFTFKFGQSVAAHGNEPTPYGVLACLTKYDPGTFENFCAEYGFNDDSRKAEKLYKAVKREFAGVERLFSDVIETLAEIA